ncbi:MAG: thioredoxin [Flavobacteriales bacterium]
MEPTAPAQSFSDLIRGEKPVVVDFTATWCGPCKAMVPIINAVKQRVGDKAVVLKVDVDRNPATAKAYAIQSVPTLMIFRNGRAVWRASGVISATQLEEVLKPFLL